MISRTVLPLFAIALIAGCSSPVYRGSVVSFGEATQAAAQAQTKRLNTLTDTHVSDIRRALAQDRVLLAYAPECALLAVPGSSIDDCRVVRRDGAAIDSPESFASLASLNKAVGDYGTNLAALAADASQDGAAFNTSLTNLAVSAEDLSTALGGAGTKDQFDAAGVAFGGIGTAAFAGARTSKLKDIIVATDPQIQQATGLLSAASEALTLSEVTTSLQRVERAERALATGYANGAPSQELERRQNTLFDEVDALKRAAAARDAYAKIGQTHAKLAQASQSSARKEDLQGSILALSKLAKLLAASADPF